MWVAIRGHSTTCPTADETTMRPARPAAAVDERAEQRRHDGEGGQGEEQVQQDLVVGGVRRDGEEERARQRNGDDGSAAEHRALHQGEPADGVGLVEQVLLGLAGHVLELLDLRGHRHHANVRCAVTVHAYVLIQTDVGKAAHVAQQVKAITGVVVAEGVTGPYDVIATVRGAVDERSRAHGRAGHPADRGHHPHDHLPRRQDLIDRDTAAGAAPKHPASTDDQVS